MILFAPLFSMVFATIEDSVLDRVKRHLEPPKELEDLILTGVLDPMIADIALYFAEEGRDEIWEDNDIDVIRAGLDAIGADGAEVVSNNELTSYYGARFGEWLVRAEPWRPKCVKNGFQVDDGVLSASYRMPPTIEQRIRAYKKEALYRRQTLDYTDADGPPGNYASLVVEIWSAPSEEARRRGFEAISIEIWKESVPEEPKKPVVQRSRARREKR